MELVIIVNNQVVVSSRRVAENFEKRHDSVLRDIENIVAGLPQNCGDLFSKTTYIHEQNKQEYPEYLMNRDGFTLLAMGFTGSAAMQWKLKYIQAFNEMEKQINSLPTMTPTQIIAAIAQQQVECEKSLKQVVERQDQQSEELQGMRNVITLNANGWRKDTAALLSKIALKLGGYEHLRDVRAESYKLLDERMGVDLQVRLTNKRRRMADEGICKSRRDKLNQLDVISNDKKLIEGYVAIVKELAIKYGAVA